MKIWQKNKASKGFWDIFMRLGCQTPDLPDNVEITTRQGKGASARFIFNNTDVSQEFAFEGRTLNLKPFEMFIEEIWPAVFVKYM